MLRKLASIATQLDALGFYEIANQVDTRIEKLADTWVPRNRATSIVRVKQQIVLRRNAYARLMDGLGSMPNPAQIPDDAQVKASALVQANALDASKNVREDQKLFEQKLEAKNYRELRARLTPVLNQLKEQLSVATFTNEGVDYSYQ
jgi:hypothetical protein